MRQLKGKTKVSHRYSQQASHSIQLMDNGVCLNDYKGSQSICIFQENAREKKERKKEFLENKDKAWTVAMPTLGVIFLFVILYVWLNSRPKVIVEQRLLLIISFMPFKHFLSNLETGNNYRSNVKNSLIINYFPCIYNNIKLYIFQYLHFRFSSRELGYASTHSCNYYFVHYFTIVTFIFHSTTLLLRHNFIGLM